MSYSAVSQIPIRYPDGGRLLMYADLPVEDISQTFATNLVQYANSNIWPLVRAEVDRATLQTRDLVKAAVQPYLVGGTVLIVAGGIAAWYLLRTRR